MLKHELRVASWKLKSTSWKLKNSWNLKVWVQIHELQVQMRELRIWIHEFKNH